MDHTGSIALTSETREHLIIALTNQWASLIAEQYDEGDFTPDDFYAVRKQESDASLILETGAETEAELRTFIDDWFYSGFWTAP